MEKIEDIIKIVSLLWATITTIIAFIQFVKDKIKNKKMILWDELTSELEKQLIPLMEEAERLLKDGQERENWVIQKLSQVTHIDFYKHKDILQLAKSIINRICKTTKIEVNKNVIIEKKEKQRKEENENAIY